MSSQSSDEPPIPTEVGAGRYRLVQSLGEGSAGKVFRAWDAERRADCAVKLFCAQDTLGELYAERFEAEAKVMRAISHRRVVPVFDSGRDRCWYWLAMEYMGGGSLYAEVLVRGALPAVHALTRVAEILEGIAVIHSAGLVHRDIKPGNILMTSQGNLKIADFGIAHHPDGTVDFVTRTNQTLGTAGFRSPEQEQDSRGVGQAADLYGAGATLYYLLLGRAPQILYMMHQNPRRLDGIAECVRPVLLRSTALDPQRRYPSARHMAVDVLAARDALRAAKGDAPRADQSLAEFDRSVAEARLPTREAIGLLGWLSSWLGGS